MQTQIERELLEKYALASNNKILDSQADLDPKDRAMPRWSSGADARAIYVVLSSGLILTCNPTSRAVQNCKIVMINKGMRPGRVIAGTSQLIQVLLANAKLKKRTLLPAVIR